MALLLMILRKMVKNKGLLFGLFVGVVFTVAMVSSMPIYTEAILDRTLVKELQQVQKVSGEYPGAFKASIYVDTGMKADRIADYLHRIDAYIEKQALANLSLPIQQFVIERSTDRFEPIPRDTSRADPTVDRSAYLRSITGLEEHVRLTDGRLPAAQAVSGVYETLVVEGALTRLDMVLGLEFAVKDKAGRLLFVVKPVGVIAKQDSADPYWSAKSMGAYDNTFFLNDALFEQDITAGGLLPVRSSQWYAALDYSKFNITMIKSYLDGMDEAQQYMKKQSIQSTIESPAVRTLKDFLARAFKLRLLLWSLYVPLMIMLGCYLMMIAHLIIERQTSEIAVMKSRGASSWQIMADYALEGILLGGLAWLAGPYLGLMLTRLLGASNGFLQLVQRDALQARLSSDAWLYGLGVVAVSLLMTLIPAYSAARATIVEHKRDHGRAASAGWAHKIFLDVLLILLALYGLRQYHIRMDNLRTLGLDSNSMQVDPMLFFLPSLFIAGAGLFALRLYPLLLRLLYRTGRRWWPPSLYSALMQVGRAGRQYHLIMMFIIITLATGLFSAYAARTLNQNTEDKIRYKNGADVILQLSWVSNAPPQPVRGQPPATPSSGQIQYVEPPFQPLLTLPGVEQAAKVFVKQDASLVTRELNVKVELMGIDTKPFGETIWFRNGLLNYPINSYLNLIAGDPSAILVSRSLADKAKLKPGDQVNIGWSKAGTDLFTVYGIIDYFPSFNPNRRAGSSGAAEVPMLVVGHLSYIQNRLALEPYDVWLKLSPDASKQELSAAIAERKIPVSSFIDTGLAVAEARKEPGQLAVNGVMTLGFLISVAICFTGFLMFWVLSFRKRTLQWGIYQAMGLPFAQLIIMLAAEQALTSGAAIGLGMLLGDLTGELFVPLFQLSFNPAEQVPPFQVTYHASDTWSLYSVMLIMILVGLGILAYLLSRIKINQALKLGED